MNQITNATTTDSSGVIAPPPVLYLGTLIIGLIIHSVSRAALFPSSFPKIGAAAVLFAGSSALASWAFITMRQTGTSASPYKPTAALSISGPFRFSRNPIYLAMSGLYLAVACLVNSIWLLLLLPPLILIMQHGVIAREERYLSAKFGEAYTLYKSEVRR